MAGKGQGAGLAGLPLLAGLFFLSLSAMAEKAGGAAGPNGSAARQTPSSPVQDAAALVEQGNAYYRRGEYMKALILYRKAESRSGVPVVAAFNIGNSLYRLGRFPQAAAAFRKAVRLSDGSHAPSLLNLAGVLFRLGQYGECVAAYRRGLRLDPDNRDGWLYLADAYARTGDRVGALKALEKARRLDPDDLSLVYRQAEAHVVLGEPDAAVELARAAFTRHPAEADFLFYIGDLYRSRKQMEKAAAAYREGLAHRPGDAESMYKLADVLALDGKPFLAMEYLRKALAADSGYADAAVFLGNLAFDARWWARAEGAYLQALKAGSREGLEGLRNIAYERYRQGKPLEAAEVLEKARPLLPKDEALAREIETYKALAQTPPEG